jgi:hypothetical protein
VDINVHRLGKLTCNELDGAWQFQDGRAFRFNEREGEDKERFAKTLGSFAERRLTYNELTGKTTR